MTANDKDPEIEFSPFCGKFTRDGVTVQVQIFRLAGSSEGWSLEVVNSDMASTVWDDLFASDQDAYSAFWEAVEQEGMKAFGPGSTLH